MAGGKKEKINVAEIPKTATISYGIADSDLDTDLETALKVLEQLDEEFEEEMEFLDILRE